MEYASWWLFAGIILIQLWIIEVQGSIKEKGIYSQKLIGNQLMINLNLVLVFRD